MIGITVAVLYLLASLKDHLSLAEEFKPEDFQEFKTVSRPQ